MKYQQDKILNLRNNHTKKFWTHKIPSRKNFELQNIHKKKFQPQEITTRKNF